MDVIHFQEIVVKASSLKHQHLLDHVRLSAQAIVNGTVIGQTTPIENEPMEAVWRLEGTLQFPASTPSYTIAIIHDSISHSSRPLRSITLSNRTILDHSDKPVSGCVRYDLQGFQHPRYSTTVTALQFQFSEEVHGGPSLEIGSVFTADLYAYVTHGSLSRYHDSRDAYPKDELISHLVPHILTSMGPGLRMQVSKDLKKIVHERVSLLPNANEKKARFLNIFGDISLNRYKNSHILDDLNQAIGMYEVAVQIAHADDLMGTDYLTDLGTALVFRFERLGALDDINNGVLLHGKAVNMTLDSHPNKASRLNNLGRSLAHRFERFGDIGDVSHAISVFQQALDLTPNDHADKASISSNLGNSLLSHFKQVGNPIDLAKAILALQNAVDYTPDGHSNKPQMLNNLGNSLASRFERLGDLKDIHRVIVIRKKALNLMPDGHPFKPTMFNNLGNSLVRRFEQLGGLDDINEAISMCEKAVNLTLEQHPAKSSMLNSLGGCLFRRFNQLGDLGDINKAISVRQKAADLTPDDHAAKPLRLNNLGNTFTCRFQHLGDLGDIDKAGLNYQKALDLTPDGHASKPSILHSFSNSLYCCFERFGNLNDINKTVLLQQKALNLIPDDHANKPAILNNLGNSLVRRFQRLRNSDDIAKAILMFEKVVNLTPDDYSFKPGVLNNFSNSLFTSYECMGETSHLNKAILMLQKAIDLTSDVHAYKPTRLSNLGNLFLALFEKQGNIDDLDKAVCYWSTSACSIPGSTSVQFAACAKWAQYASQFPHYSAFKAYTVALDLLPQLSWPGLSVQDRQYHLLTAGEVVRNAVSAAISQNQFETAMEWLEQGRSVIWGQLLQLRTPMDNLKLANPKLGNRLEELSKKLEGAATQHQLLEMPFGEIKTDISANSYHDLAYEREDLIKQIRTLDGFDRFLLPQTFLQLLPAASTGPVVTINISQERCDALIIMPGLDDVLHIALDQFSYKKAEQLYRSLRFLLKQRGVFREVDRKGALVSSCPIDLEAEFEHILSELWLDVAKPILDGLAIMTTGLPIHKLPHVWWCLTGPLAFLPIHAAGLYGPNAVNGSKLSDFVVSSYTPTLTSLHNGVNPRIPQRNRLLTVALPKKSKPALPGTQVELDIIHKQIGDFPILQLLESKATVDSVIDGMKGCSWVHFACHGIQDISNPIESALMLAGDSKLSLSKVIRLSLPHAELAFLSACQTATGAEDLSEEAVYLAAGMLLAGYRGVIATMWSIQDSDGPIVADDVYSHLFKHSQPDATQAVYALHMATQKLYEGQGTKSFFSWVPFIHIGI